MHVSSDNSNKLHTQRYFVSLYLKFVTPGPVKKEGLCNEESSSKVWLQTHHHPPPLQKKIFFSLTWSFPLDKYLLTYWKVKVSENAIFLRYFQNLHLQVWVRCGCAKPFFQNFSKSSEILEYFPYLDHFHSTKTRWHIGRSKSVKNPYFWRGGQMRSISTDFGDQLLVHHDI